MLQNVIKSSVSVVVGFLYLPSHFIIIVISSSSTIAINTIFITFDITRIFEEEQFTLLMRQVDRLVLFPWISSFVLTWFMRPPFGVDALPWYYYLESFNYGDMKTRDIGPIWAILCLIVYPVITERLINISDYFLLWVIGIMLDNNYVEYSECWLFSISECGKYLNYERLRQAGLIIPK